MIRSIRNPCLLWGDPSVITSHLIFWCRSSGHDNSSVDHRSNAGCPINRVLALFERITDTSLDLCLERPLREELAHQENLEVESRAVGILKLFLLAILLMKFLVAGFVVVMGLHIDAEAAFEEPAPGVF